MTEQKSPPLMRRIPKMHMAIIGETGGGKSYLAQSWGTHPGRNSIYFDYCGKISESKYAVYADSAEELALGMQKFTQISFITDDKATLVQALEFTWDSLYHLNMQEPCYIMLDEVQFYSDEEVVENIFHLGRKYNIYGVLVSRNLQDTVHRRAGVISQCTDIMIIGGLTDVGEKRLRDNYSVAITDDVKAHINAWHWKDEQRVSDHNSAYWDGMQWDLYDSSYKHVKRVGK